MNKNILIILAIFLISSVSATQICQIYDDFSSSVLNTSKWEEGLTARTNPAIDIDEHYLDITNQNYHTAQLSQADSGSGIELKSLQNLQAGDILEFDLIYNFGSGNHWGCVFWDETSTWSDGLTCIGNWNEVNSHPGEFGVYHIKGTYKEAGLDMEITLPNSSIETGVYSNINPPYTFSVVTKTGHNGLLHIDYDNFTICTEPPEPSLEERVGLLESWKQAIEEWKNTIIQEISNVWLAITELTTRVEALENKTETNLSKYANYMSFAERKTMLCGYAKANNLTSIQDLGLSCKLIYKRKAVSCNCVEV